jgi:hypothetical protein
VPLTRREKQKIYEEELERIKTRERIQAERTQPKSSRAMNWAIIFGFGVMLYIDAFYIEWIKSCSQLN